MEYEQLLKRVEQLEKKTHRLTAALVCLVAVVACGVGIAAKPGDDGIIEARGFVIRDEDGKRRADISVNEVLGQVTLSMLDRHGKPLVQLSASDDASDASLVFQDQDGNMRAQLRTKKDRKLKMPTASLQLWAQEDPLTDHPSVSLYSGGDLYAGVMIQKFPQGTAMMSVSEDIPGITLFKNGTATWRAGR